MSKRFRIAFSFAGEKRTFVAEMARILAARFGEDQILYDKFHEGEFARGDLAIYLPKLYYEQADLVVGVFCKEYIEKEWCGLEWNAIFGLIKQRKMWEVMLMRFDQVEPEGLLGLAGFSDLDSKTPVEGVNLILQRLAINEGHEKDFYATPQNSHNDWPDAAPSLYWPVANHSEAQASFAELITRGSPKRLLLILGPTETGKTHLTMQFLGNANSIKGIRCGRFDFKGSADMDQGLALFADQLEVDRPSSGPVSSRLAEIFETLKRSARPTLLIFDTFELAGEAERWVKESLLLALQRAPWLRIIVVAQRGIKAHGEPWYPISSPVVGLRSPEPEEWFEYSKAYQQYVPMDIDEIRKVHKMVAGKSPLLAQILGPKA